MSRATLTGFIAILLWALLALFTVGTSPVPPFQLNALTFAIGGAIGVVWLLRTGGVKRLKGVPLSVYAFGTIGLFGYHALYFSALRLAPAAEASLIAYLWPLLIVILSGLLPGEKLRLGHILGAFIGFAGAALIVGGKAEGLDPAHIPGYLLALCCAFTWSSYSVISRRLGSFPTETVVVYCIATALLSVPAHLALEETLWPNSLEGWLCILGLGAGPVGLAFYTWDHGVKKGDIQLLGVASYAAPLLSTLVLVIAGFAAPTWTLALAASLITAGAALAARTSLKRASKAAKFLL
ncbi:MAG TPA: EamA family transporter [Rhodobacteraceae bacterium]|jgi:drug/metabolite transporter (DMT)-like permease|nr:EamA family transporter [Paracoccaceae bacterium]